MISRCIALIDQPDSTNRRASQSSSSGWIGPLAEPAEVVGRADQAFAEVPEPDPVDHHPGGQRMIGPRAASRPARAGRCGSRRSAAESRGQKTRREPSRDLFAERQVIAPDVNLQVGRLLLLDAHHLGDRRGVLLERGELFAGLAELVDGLRSGIASRRPSGRRTDRRGSPRAAMNASRRRIGRRDSRTCRASPSLDRTLPGPSLPSALEARPRRLSRDARASGRSSELGSRSSADARSRPAARSGEGSAIASRRGRRDSSGRRGSTPRAAAHAVRARACRDAGTDRRVRGESCDVPPSVPSEAGGEPRLRLGPPRAGRRPRRPRRPRSSPSTRMTDRRASAAAWRSSMLVEPVVGTSMSYSTKFGNVPLFRITPIPGP